MVKNKTKVHRSYDDTITESITCDICKKTYKGSDWERENYSALETEVRMKTGSVYPEGGMGEEITFDICPTCFEAKLIPALKELGAQPTISDWDW